MIELLEDLKNDLLDDGYSLKTINIVFKKINEYSKVYPDVTPEQWVSVAEITVCAAGKTTKGIDYDGKEHSVFISINEAFATAMEKELDIQLEKRMHK